ncbi:MAG: DUF1573 domain-containing protein [Pyrinomonadaceae bacterium]|nr:DUF1573 domain-containing protein [Sphingobacteriaceae bacterium]
MNRIIFTVLIASIVFGSCNSDQTKGTSNDSTETSSSTDAPILQFDKDNYDFGKIKQGEKAAHEYKFTNTGKTPLIITDATATCGCTIPEYPKEPVAPGQSGVIKVVFDSANKSGMQHKVVTITSNTNPATTEVYLTGEVIGGAVVKNEETK